MNIAEFIKQLNDRGVKLRADGERLRFDAPAGVVTASLRAELADRKAELLKFFEQAQAAARSKLPPVQAVPRDHSIPLSFAQRRLWFLDQLTPQSPEYNILRAYRVDGPLQVETLARSLNEIARRHEALRTHIEVIDRDPVQRIAPTVHLALSVDDLSGLPMLQRESKAQQIATDEYLLPFSIDKGPLIRARLLRLAAQEHLFVLVIHHIVTDGWSMGVLIRELTVLYGEYCCGNASPLAPLAVQYADYTLWQRQWLSGDVLEKKVAYWKQRLAGVPTLELPTDRRRHAARSFSGGHQDVAISKQLTDSLKKLSQEEGVTMFMTLLAAFNVLLHRYSGQEDIAVGSPIANRNRPELESLIGFFVNTLVLRTDLSDGIGFRQLLRRVRSVVLEAFAHQDLPFEKLVEELDPQRDLSRNPLFQVMFAFQNMPQHALALADLKLTPHKVDNTTAKFDLVLSLEEQGDSLNGSLEYDADLFDAATAGRLTRHYKNLLAAAVVEPDRPLAQLAMLEADEREQVLLEWNDTERPYPADTMLHQFLERQAERTPEAMAAELDDERWTYRELNERGNQMAFHLLSLGVAPGVLVGICMDRSLEMLVAVLGVLKAGGGFVGLDPANPKERLAFMILDARTPVVVTQSHLVNQLPEHDAQVICLDSREARGVPEASLATPMPWEEGPPRSRLNPQCDASPDQTAYIVYTSGSTGQPKGIVMGHGPVCNMVHWQIEHTEAPGPTRTLQFAALSFDISLQEMFTTWGSGGTIVMVREPLRRDATALLRYLDETSVERLFLPFVALQQLAEAAVAEKFVPGRLREVTTAGEQLQITPALAEFMRRLDCPLHNQYGPSEAHVVTSFRLAGDPSAWPKLPPVGRPLANVQIYLLDGHMNPVPIGVPGQLHIGGACLASGYLRRPDVTAQAFIPDPFSQQPGTRLYKTGDLARYLPDGNIEFLGRLDSQVKIRGFRVELGEIEAVLAQHENVQDVVVLARQDDTAGDNDLRETRLVAYVVQKTNDAEAMTGYRNFLKQKLPGYMVPASFMILPRLPLTTGGKVDRKALPVAGSHRQLGDTYVEPRTETERLIAGVWEQVLRTKQMGVDDNFFESGGHSLLATQVISRLRDSFQVEVLVIHLFEHPTVAELAERIDQLLLEKVEDLTEEETQRLVARLQDLN